MIFQEKKDEAKKDEAKKDEVKKDEAKKDEAKKDEAVKDTAAQTTSTTAPHTVPVTVVTKNEWYGPSIWAAIGVLSIIAIYFFYRRVSGGEQQPTKS